MSPTQKPKTNQPAPAPRQPYVYPLEHSLNGDSYSVRQNLADIIERELLGPSRGPEEELPYSPRSHYLVGWLAPVKIDSQGAQQAAAVEGTDDLTDPPVNDPEAPGQEATRELLVGDLEPNPGAHTSAGGLLVAADTRTETDDEDDAEDRVPKQGSMLPSSMGLRFQVPDHQESITVIASWGTYRSVKTDQVTISGKTVTNYQRTHHEHEIRLKLAELTPGITTDVPITGNILLRVDRYEDPARNRALIEVALCNNEHTVFPIPGEKWMFQTKLTAHARGAEVFLPVRDVLTETSTDKDPEISHLNLLYRNRLEFAIGRSCSATWVVRAGASSATEVSTTWLPTSETPQTEAKSVEGVQLSMNALATGSAADIRAGLQPLTHAYSIWLANQENTAVQLPDHLQGTAQDALEKARTALSRLNAGIEHLADTPPALKAFHFMNRVMRDQRLRSQIAAERAADSELDIGAAEQKVAERGESAASWRVFQLAFILLQLPALTDPTHEDRSDEDIASAELLFFPTGGGKTEAYLGLAAYTFAIRRLQGRVQSSQGALDGSDGVAVMMRYTLRLLTSQQFQRATTLMCAAELARQEDPETWGYKPFRIGLWVGTDVSPKYYDDAKKQVADSLSRNGRTNQLTVLQIQRCPWCGEKITASNIKTQDETRRVLIYCGNALTRCPFSQGGTVAEGLPMLTVDEEIYALTPAFVIATVDKFARLAREGQAASLFGYVRNYCPRHGYQHPDSSTRCKGSSHQRQGNHPASTVTEVGRLRPPDLIIQDELHLITGALGTAVGLFETTVEVLCNWQTSDGSDVRPMIIASTATVRNASQQIHSLYGRSTNIFPPQVLDVEDTFFSQEKPVDQTNPGRLYLGVSTPGVRFTSAEIRVAEVLLSAGKLLYNRSEEAHPGANLADPYMSMVAYFNATRELAGMSRYLAGDIYTRVKKPRFGSGFVQRFGSAGMGQFNVGELTSRISSAQIGQTLDELALEFDPTYDTTEAALLRAEQRRTNNPVAKRASNRAPFDAVLATSMLQVGVDVQRFGLMLMVGQPKNTAEYIQASSRVGRDANRPGLVVSLHNWARPRDLAHFEQFRHYHETFYSQVEALSVTPFSATAIERGLDGLFVSAVRVLEASQEDGLSAEDGAGRIHSRIEAIDALIGALVRRAQKAQGTDEAYTELLDQLQSKKAAWLNRQHLAQQRSLTLVYEKTMGGGKIALLRSPEATVASAANVGNQAPFVVANSMREVQPEINLLVSPVAENLFQTSPHNAPTWAVPQPEGDS